MSDCPPIAFIIFNRPKPTRRVFERIRAARPAKLYLIADAPRPNKPGEAGKCAETRRLVEGMVDWPCEVHKNYAEKNMGCGGRIPSGLDWVFELEERAIIMEDDILADPSFFPFCAEMLERYKDDERIMQVGGYNRFQYAPSGQADYFYSRFSDIWGWATWRRAWEQFRDFDLEKWNAIRDTKGFHNLCYSQREAEMRQFCLDQIFSGQLNAWGMRWDTTKLIGKGLGIVPAKSLTRNIGFGFDASHTVNPLNPQRFLKTHRIAPPYNHPEKEESDSTFDSNYNRKMFPNRVATEKIRSGILKLMGKK